jgi:hypothetical protein
MEFFMDSIQSRHAENDIEPMNIMSMMIDEPLFRVRTFEVMAKISEDGGMCLPRFATFIQIGLEKNAEYET